MLTEKRTVELDITSDVYITQDGAAYNSPSEAIEDALDNCLNGMDESIVTPENPRKIQIIFHTLTKDGGIPHAIDIIDNGIGMSEETVLHSLFLTNMDNAGSHGVGGTSTWGMGYKSFTNYLGKPGEVYTRTLYQAENDLPGTVAKISYEKGKQPEAEVGSISSELLSHECGEVLTNGHGTKITIRNIKTSKWSTSWWNPQGQTYYKSWAKRYNRLLDSGKLEIDLIQKTPSKVLPRSLEASQKVLDSNPSSDVENQDTAYLGCSRNGWNVKGEGISIEGYGVKFPTNMGKHLSAIQSKPWKSVGQIPLISHSVAKSANPTIYLYQNDVLVATIPFKDTERSGGLAHLNGLFVEIDVPTEIKIPTNLQKSSVDASFKEAVKVAIKKRAEKLWKPIDVSEAEYHRIFQEMTYNEFQGEGIRNKFFDGNSVDSLKGGLLVHEHQQGSMKPDFKFFDDNKEVKRIIEFKDETCNSEVSHQLAAYHMEHPTAVEIILVAPGFKETLTQTLNKWTKTSGVKFSYYSFSDLGIKEITSI